jgi:ketosteroid isomerase-like protein
MVAMTHDELANLLAQWRRAYLGGERAFFMKLLDDDIDWIMHGPPQAFPVPNKLHGKLAVIAAMRRVQEALEVVKNEVRSIMVDGDRAAVISDRTVIQRSTGRTLVYTVAAFMQFRNDKLIEYRAFYDSFDMLEQVIGRTIEVPAVYPR